jgi:hypothetical protein
MATFNPVIKSFNAGEFSPLMEGRLELDKFPDSCRTLENAICTVQGPATRRGAFRYIREVKTSAKKTRILPFEVGADAAYVLEMGDLYFRFYQPVARIESDGVPVEVATPYLEADLFGFHYAQSADLLYLVKGAYAPRKLSRLSGAGTDWGFKLVKFNPPPTFEDDTDVSGGTVSLSPDAITGSGIKIFASEDVFLAADKDRLLKYLDGLASITAVGGPREITVEFIDDFPYQFTPVPGTGTVTTVGADAYFLAQHGLAIGDWIRLTDGAQAGEKKRVVAVPDETHATLESAYSVDQAGTAWSLDREITGAAGWKLGGSPVATLTPSADSPVGAIATLTLAADGWRAVDVTLGKYVRAASGIVKLSTYTSPTVVSGQIVKVLENKNDVAGGAWSAEVPSWSATAGYPSAACFFEERFFLGGTTRKPTSVWGSQNGDYENFGVGVNAADAVLFPLTSIKVNTVRWILPAKSLLGGTVSGEFSIAGEADAAITPTNPRPRSETTHGGSDVMPVRVGHLVIFVQAHGRKVRELSYDYQPDAFVAPDLTRFAEHITKGGGVVDMAYQQEPHSILWCVRADGVLLGLTYAREEKVYGWHRHVTDGYFESICVIPDTANHRDQLWAVVRRNIGGATKRYIEVLDPDVVAADSFAAYSGDPVTWIGGLSHLEGKAVDVVADGFAVSGHVVAEGAITLARAASDVVVGLHYETTVTPHRQDYVDDKGRTTIGKKKQWAEVILRLYETGLSGVTLNGKSVPARAGSDPLGSATALVTGDVPAPLLGTDRDGILTIRQTLPLPFTLLAITGTLDVGD